MRSLPPFAKEERSRLRWPSCRRASQCAIAAVAGGSSSFIFSVQFNLFFCSAFFAHLCRQGPSAGAHHDRETSQKGRIEGGGCRRPRGNGCPGSCPRRFFFGQEERLHVKRTKSPPRTKANVWLWFSFRFFFDLASTLHFRNNKDPSFLARGGHRVVCVLTVYKKDLLGASTAALP